MFLREEEKRQIISDYLTGSETKRAVYSRYTSYDTEHGKISKWMKEFGIEDKVSQRHVSFTAVSKSTKENNDLEYENLNLQKRIDQLEASLKEQELKAIAYSTMVDMAEEQFNIPIRKKSNTKLTRPKISCHLIQSSF
ncbi:MAG: transposase [bacterium]